MRLLTATLLASVSLIALSATSAEAKGLTYGNNTFGGKVSLTLGHNTNAAAAPAKAAKDLDDDEDEDEDEDFEAFGEDDGLLDDLVEDQDLNDEDIAEDDGEEDDDDDDDGTPDFAEAGTPARVHSDERAQYALGLNHSYKFSKTMAWNSAFLAGVSRQNDQNQLNRHNWAINTGPVFNIKSWNVTVNPSITYASLNSNHKFQNESTIASLATKWAVNKQLALSARVNKEFRNNLRPRTTNVNVEALKIGATYKLTKNDKFAIGWAPKVENNENNIKSKEAWSADVGYARKLPWGLLSSLTYKYGESKFINGNAPLREDETHQYGFGIGKNFEDGIFVNMGAAYKSKQANIANKGNHDRGVFFQTGWKF